VTELHELLTWVASQAADYRATVGIELTVAALRRIASTA
jgi:hypothetical protein